MNPKPFASILSVLSDGDTVMSGSQLSVAVRVPAAGTSAGHSTVTSAGAEGATGFYEEGTAKSSTSRQRRV